MPSVLWSCAHENYKYVNRGAKWIKFVEQCARERRRTYACLETSSRCRTAEVKGHRFFFVGYSIFVACLVLCDACERSPLRLFLIPHVALARKKVNE